MRRRKDGDTCRKDGKECKAEEAYAVDDHPGKFPVRDDLLVLVVFPHSARDKTQLPEDALQFPLCAEARVVEGRLVPRRPPSPPAPAHCVDWG